MKFRVWSRKTKHMQNIHWKSFSVLNYLYTTDTQCHPYIGEKKKLSRCELLPGLTKFREFIGIHWFSDIILYEIRLFVSEDTPKGSFANIGSIACSSRSSRKIKCNGCRDQLQSIHMRDRSADHYTIAENDRKCGCAFETTRRRRICACFTVVSRTHVLLKQTCANSTTVEPH